MPGTEYTFYMNPHVAKDFTDAFILKVAGEYLPKVNRPWHEKEFTTGTDTYLAEPMVGVPTVWGYSGSGVETHHNSEDTPDRVDERSLRDISVIDAAFLYFIANAGEPEALWLARLSESRGYEQILKAASPFLDLAVHASNAESAGKLLAQAEAKIAYSVDRESQAVSSVLRLVPESDRARCAHRSRRCWMACAGSERRNRPGSRRCWASRNRSKLSDSQSEQRREDRGQAQTLRHAAAGRSAARSMGRLSFRAPGPPSRRSRFTGATATGTWRK